METGSKDKREAIIAAAERIFSRKGFFQAKVEEIAAEAGVGKGTVYEYFSSKEDVFKEMVIHITQDIKLDFLGKDDFASSTEEIKKIIEENLKFVRKHKSMARMLMQEHMTVSDEVFQYMKEIKNEGLKSLEDIIVDGIKKGEFRQDINSMVTAHLILGAIMSLSGDIIQGDDAISVMDLTDNVIEMMLYGIASAKDKNFPGEETNAGKQDAVI